MLKPKNPFMSNNGLCVVDRTSQSITLKWPSAKELLIPGDVIGVSEGEGVEERSEDEKSREERATGEDCYAGWNSDNNWFELQMRKCQSQVWRSIYRGYGDLFTIDDIPPDTAFVFRMKRNKELEWGTEVLGSSDPSPPSTEDLNRAVEMNSTYLTCRILDLTKASHLKKILSARDRHGMTPLMTACQVGNVAIAEKLILAGSDINAMSSNGLRTPLIIACIMGKEPLAALLDTHGADWTVRDRCGCNAHDYALNGGHLPLIKLAYLRLPPKFLHIPCNGWTPLMRAVILCNNLGVIRFLLSKGTDPNATDKSNSKSVLMSAILSKKPQFVQYLLSAGANANYVNASGKSCLNVAKGLELREMTEILTRWQDNKEKETPS